MISINKEFKPIPGYESYVINEDGVVIDTIWNYCLLEKRSPSLGYRWFYLERIKEPVHTHVLKARTFLRPVPGREYVNHIDGDKENNAVTNLEWVTPSENLIHAFRSGLRTDNNPLSVLDNFSGRVLEFFSQNEASRYLGVNPEKLHRYLKSRRTALFLGRYVVAYQSESLPVVVGMITRLKLNGLATEVVVEYAENNRVVILPSISFASKYLGLSVGTISARLNQPPTVIDGVVIRTRQPIDIGKAIGTKKPVAPVRKPLKIRVFDRNNNVTRLWDSLEEFALWAGSNKSTVQKSVYLKGGWKNFEIEYLR